MLTVGLLQPFVGLRLTNRNHSRRGGLPRALGLTVWAHEADADQLEAGADRTVTGGTINTGTSEIVPVPGKSPGETALHLPRSGALIVGDLVIGVPPGELSTYPEEVIDDRAKLRRSAARLLHYDIVERDDPDRALCGRTSPAPMEPALAHVRRLRRPLRGPFLEGREQVPPTLRRWQAPT